MKIIKIDPKRIESKKIIQSLSLLKEGKIIVCPTDTVYGLIADATNKKAVEKVFKIKKRPKGKPIPIFVKDINTAKKIAEINKEQEKFLRKCWPGKTTLVLKFKSQNSKVKNISQKLKVYGAGRKNIAFRIPKYKIINYFLKKCSRPLTGTSANISGKPASTKIKKITEQFKNQKNKPDLVINVGNLKFSKPSKVIDLTGKKIKILRK